ncbi:hypothetical protein KFE25_005579 [Diacronema lutheri]|uniref:Strictosidine synthase conserved region domain-containing protein n=2 Tax=Diacronema lutheri TaxID=2081491 RepID=A0A8J5XT04_DIALT|nr:hypothetical protein KFE25_005579 [Diacronema lutheri]
MAPSESSDVHEVDAHEANEADACEMDSPATHVSDMAMALRAPRRWPPSARAVAAALLCHSVGVVLVGAFCGARALSMPDGTGPVLHIAPERVALLVSGAGKLATVLARDPSERLRACVHWHRGQIVGPESIVASANGSLFALDRVGWLHRADPSADGAYKLAPAIAYVGPGRPLGAELDADRLRIADSLKGLTELELPSGRLAVLSNGAAYVNDLATDASGRVYFTSSTREPVELTRVPAGQKPFYDTMGAYLRTMARGDATGRLLRYNPETFQTDELLGGLWFANGVALAAGGEFALVVETLGLRVLRLWLTGPKAGAVESFAAALPGLPDGISRSADGETFWLAIIAPWTPLLKLLKFRMLRGLLARVLPVVLRFVKPIGLVLRLRASDGALVDVLADASGSHVSSVSAVTEAADGRLLLGQLMGDSLVVCPRVDEPAACRSESAEVA